MTAKRFKSINCGLQGQYIKDNGKILAIEDVVELLNELHEENTKLKQVNEMLHMDFAITEQNLMEENEEQCLAIMAYLHNNYYNVWEKVNKEVFKE